MMAKRSKSRPEAARSYRVFISHATADKWVAKMVCEKIDAIEGASTFRDDRDVDGGDSIPEVIIRELMAADEFLVLLTPKSVTRAWVLMEVGIALSRFAGLRIVPVLHHVDFDPIPNMIKSRKGYDLNEFDQYLSQLEQRVKRGRA